MKLPALSAALLCVASAGALADAEHDRIAADRAAANAKLAEQVRQCETRFIVSPCLEESRKENRARLAELRQEELALDESRRRAAAEARRKALAERAEVQDSRASDVAPDAPRERVRREPPASSTSGQRAMPPRSAHAASAAIDRPLFVQRSQASFDARARDAQAHRDAVARRNAERAASGKVASPLPTPPGASAPR